MSSISFGSAKALAGKEHRTGTQGKADIDLRGDVEAAILNLETFLPINLIALQGDGVAIAITADDSGYCFLTSGAGAETRLLARPNFYGQRLRLNMVVDGGGDIVITPDGGINNGQTFITFNDAGDFTELVGVLNGADLEWCSTGGSATLG